MKGNLLIITQKVDEEDDLLGFFVSWLREFSEKFDKVFVITLAKGNYTLPPNIFVYSLGKEKNNSKINRFFNFYKYLFKLVPQSIGVFAHMSPIFVIASWPVAFIFRKKIILWYLHRSVTTRLKIAEKLSYKIVTATRESLKINSTKTIETGHGINIDKFKTNRDWLNDGLKILSIGRISPIKNYETLIKALAILKKDVLLKAKIVGRPIMPPDFEYLDKLKKMVASGLVNVVNLIGYVPYTKMPEYYKDANLVINLAPTGGLDKVVLEAMASGCIVLTSNSNFAKYFESYGDKLVFDFNNSEDLALKIRRIRSMSQDEKKEISGFLIQSVQQNHNLINVIDQISKLYERT